MLLQNLCQLLERSKVKYALVGGYAVSLHGAVRGTVDIDLVVALEPKALAQIEQILLQLGLEPRIPLRAAELAQFREEYIRERNLIAWSFVNAARPIDLVDIIITHDVRDFKVETLNTVFGKVKVASAKDLIAMKRSSGRPQDLIDIAALEKIMGKRHG